MLKRKLSSILLEGENKQELITMKQVYLYVLFCLFFLNGFAQTPSSKKEIVAYYPDWQVYDRNKLASPDHLDYKKLTTIVYAFFVPNANGELSTKDTYITELILKGKRNWQLEGKPEYYPNSSLVELAHSKKTEVLISIGGWTGSDHFSSIAADSLKRKTFTKECIRLIDEYGVDGFDIDWEFPGRGSASDSIHFTSLLKEIREALDQKEIGFRKRDKRDLILTIAISSSDQHMKYIQWNKVLPYLDYINVMSYDYAGFWVPTNAHKSPLFSAEEGGESIANSISILKNKYAIPDSMMNVGSSFTGNVMSCSKGKNQLGDNHNGAYDKTLFAASKGQPTFYEIKETLHLFDEKWDSLAHVNYYESKDSTLFLSCETERSVIEKAQFVKARNLNGVVIWDITGDMLESKPGSGFVKKRPLLEAIYEGLKD